jgi:hypothetical protein
VRGREDPSRVVQADVTEETAIPTAAVQRPGEEGRLESTAASCAIGPSFKLELQDGSISRDLATAVSIF